MTPAFHTFKIEFRVSRSTATTMINPQITRQDVLEALKALSRSKWQNDSKKFDLLWKQKRYPPKEVIRKAAELAGVELGDFSGGKESNSFLEKRGFVVVGKHGELQALNPVEEDPETASQEGAKVLRQHLARERNGKLPRLVKERRLAETGELRCDVCDFSFLDAYGERGAGFIEAHHDRPLAITDGQVETKLSDFSLVCSNCHSMLHRTPLITVSGLRRLTAKATDRSR